MGIATRKDLRINIAKGLGQHIIGVTSTAHGGGTAVTTSSGSMQLAISCNGIGTTLPGTRVGYPELTSPPNDLIEMLTLGIGDTVSRIGFLVRLYEIGTLNLGATGDQLTHSSGTFPLLRTVYGAASQPFSLIPLIYITTAPVNGASMQLRTNAGAAGYTNQAGSTVIGSRTFTVPNNAVAQSCYVLRLEEGDCGVQDINQIKITSSATGGAATIFGMEIMAPMPSLTVAAASLHDGILGGFGGLMNPATPTSGSVTSMLATILVTSSTTKVALYSASAMNV